MTNEDSFLTDHEVAALLNISVATIRRWRRTKEGPKYYKIGSLVRYKRADIDEWVRSQGVDNAT